MQKIITKVDILREHNIFSPICDEKLKSPNAMLFHDAVSAENINIYVVAAIEFKLGSGKEFPNKIFFVRFPS
jgi:hypothetical protein